MNTRRRAAIIGASMILTLIIVRSLLQMSPNSDFDIAGYNIHHLFTGLILIAIGGIPLILFSKQSLVFDLLCATFGIGLSLALDEWVYLIVTDGTNASYLLPVSLKGGIAMVALAAAYVAILYMLSKDKQPPSHS